MSCNFTRLVIALDNREDILEEGDSYVIKATNAPVPVQVQEVMRSDPTGKGRQSSICMHTCIRCAPLYVSVSECEVGSYWLGYAIEW